MMGLRVSGALTYRTVTAMMINSQTTLNLCKICCSTCVHRSPWDLVEFISGCSESWLMLSQDFSKLFFHVSWESGEISVDWKLANVGLVFKKDKKEDPDNYRPVCLALVPGKLMEKIMLGVTEKDLKGYAVIGHSQYILIM